MRGKEIVDQLCGTKEEREKAKIELVNNISDEDLVVLADINGPLHKGCMAEAADILRTIGYPRIRPVLPHLMVWFQDVNWPGVKTIIDIFRGISPNDLVPYIEDGATQSINENDDFWAWGFVSLIKQLNLEDTVNSALLDQLLDLSQYERD